MGTISKRNGRLPLRPSGTQLKSAITYILLTASVLFFLNYYTSSTMRSMIFSAKQRSMQDKAQIMATALLQTAVLEEHPVSQTVNSLEDVHTTRTVVTDGGAVALYDSLEAGNATGKLIFFPEILRALKGSNVFYCQYENEAIESRVAIPLMRSGEVHGVIYLMEYDRDQGALIAALERNVMSISVALEIAIVLMSTFFSMAFSRKLQRILHSVRAMREGDYANQIVIKGRDELSLLSREFNDLAERLDASEQRRRQFVSDASHELKTPLASIKLLSDSILQNEMDEQTQREFIGDIGREADRLGRLTQKLLTLTKLDSALEEEREVVEAASVVDKVVRMLRPLAKLRSITIEHETQTVHLRMVSDDLYQIVFNLTENAIKYNKDHGTVLISLARVEGRIVLTVKDSGVGIPEDSLAHIFDRFYRVDKARSRAAGGAGLGLSIVHDMVKRNFGTIRAERRNEGGTCFIVSFPPYEEDEA